MGGRQAVRLELVERGLVLALAEQGPRHDLVRRRGVVPRLASEAGLALGGDGVALGKLYLGEAEMRLGVLGVVAHGVAKLKPGAADVAPRHHLPRHHHGVAGLVQDVPSSGAAAEQDDDDGAGEENGFLGHGRSVLP